VVDLDIRKRSARGPKAQKRSGSSMWPLRRSYASSEAAAIEERQWNEKREAKEGVGIST